MTPWGVEAKKKKWKMDDILEKERRNKREREELVEREEKKREKEGEGMKKR